MQPGGTGGVPVITIQYKPFGVQLTFTPTVLENGIINLRLAPSVSELNFAQAVTRSPASTSRRSTSAKRAPQSNCVTARASQSPACCRRTIERNISQLPWIGSVPVLGALFSSKLIPAAGDGSGGHRHAPSRRSGRAGQRLASPLDNHIPSNDVDFFLMGEMEQKKDFRDYITSGGDIQGPYGHIIGQRAGCPRAQRVRSRPRTEAYVP